jgi:putative ABC transport system substrate-binding protein
MRRREFITLLGGALAAQAIPANAQELRVRTVGVLMGFPNDAEAKARVQAFEQGLERVGWSVGQNLRIEYRYAEGDSVRMQALAKELVELKPDCILGHSTPVVTALMEATRTIPIVFVSVSDPIGSGFVASMARPAGNMTGFTIDTERNGAAARSRSHPLQSRFSTSRRHILFDSIGWRRQGIQGPADHSSSAQPRRD